MKETIAGTVISYMSLEFLDDKLQSVYVSIPSGEIERVGEALLVKFPDAKEEREPLQTRVGATYTNVSLVWKAPGVTMRLQKYSGNINDGAFLVVTDAFIETSKREEREAAKGAAKDL